MRRGMLALVVLLLACVLMAGAVSAEENAVTVTIGEYTRSYSTLVDAFADAVNFSIESNSQFVTVTLNKDLTGVGIGIFNDDLSGSKKSMIVLDLGSYTYTCVGLTVGSKGTKSQGIPSGKRTCYHYPER